MKKFILITTVILLLFTNCDDAGTAAPVQHAKEFSAEVAIQWTDLQQDLTKSTPGFDPLVASRAFAYAGLALYESMVKGMPGYNSVVSPRIGSDINALAGNEIIYWPASANAAIAFMLKSLYANTSAANMEKIVSLEAAFEDKFVTEVSAEIVKSSATYGRKVAGLIFEWSKTDGGHEAYLAATDDSYVPPSGPGKWIPTPPAMSQPVRPYWGNNRSFVPNSATSTMPDPPPAYSKDQSSEFYKAVHELYKISISLTEDNISVVKTWGDLPGNYGTSSHYTNIATQLIKEKGLKLDKAVLTYAKHGMAIYEATIAVFKAKYTYNLIRPVSYMHNELGNDLWTTVIGTPPHPEYPSAHAVIGGASYTTLESVFGEDCAFVDRTHEQLFGARTYENLKAYAEEAAGSRVLAGIHYKFSSQAGLAQGVKIGNLINQIPFEGSAN